VVEEEDVNTHFLQSLCCGDCEAEKEVALNILAFNLKKASTFDRAHLVSNMTIRFNGFLNDEMIL
jgi:hypothetical protein